MLCMSISFFIYLAVVNGLLLCLLFQRDHLLLLGSSQLFCSSRSVFCNAFLWPASRIICFCPHFATWFSSFYIHPIFIIPPLQRCFLLGRRTASIWFFPLLFHRCLILLNNLATEICRRPSTLCISFHLRFDPVIRFLICWCGHLHKFTN